MECGTITFTGMRRLSRVLAILSVLAVTGSVLAACGGQDDARLTIYSGRTKDLVGPLLERFSKETGIQIDVRYGDSTDLALLIDTEGDRSPADVFFSQAAGAVGLLDAKERLLDLPADVLDRVDERFRATDGRWVGTSARVRVLVYNRVRVRNGDLPESVFDLVDPEYRGKVGVAPSNASFQDFVSAMREAEGDDRTAEWLDGMAANDARTYANNVAIVDAVARGEIEMGLVNHYYNVRAKEAEPDLASENHFFSGGDLGSLVLASAIGVLDTAGDRRADAERLVAFLLSEETQRYFAEETDEYPLVAGVDADPSLPALDSIEAPEMDLSSLGADLETTRRLIDESGLSAG